MARPTGRYFASVISKIRDAKKKEQIVVDDGFKMQLRQNIMMKINAQVQPPRVSWIERLLPLKSYLAVVPAFALVIVAVVGISKLPIDFKSNTVVPVSVPQTKPVQNQTANNQNVIASNQQTPVLNNQTSNNAQTGGLKTFPGRYVLPGNRVADVATAPTSNSAYSNDAVSPQMLQANVENVQPVQNTVSNNPQNLQNNPQPQFPNVTPQPQQNVSAIIADNVVSPQPQYTTEPSAAPVTPVAENVQTGLQTNSQNNETVTSAPAPSFTGSTPIVQDQQVPSVSGSSPLASVAQTTSTPVVQNAQNVASAPAILPNSTNVTSTPTPSPSPASVSPSTAMTMSAPVLVTPPSAPAVNPAPVVNKVNSNEIVKPKTTVLPQAAKQSLGLNDIALLPAEHLHSNIIYSGNFSTDEKTILEKNLIPHLADGKDVDVVHVYQESASLITIEMHETNGQTIIYDYSVSPSGELKLNQSIVARPL